MTRTPVEDVAGIVAARQARRSLVRMAGAALLGGAGMIAFGAGADAAQQRKKNKGKNRCRKGAVLDRVQVPADGSPVKTKRLEQGQSYRLRVSGVITDADWGLDGEYYFWRDDPDDLSQVYDACFDGTPVGVEVSGAEFSGWGGYDEDHGYERKVTGEGKPLTLRLSDCNYDDQTGSLKVEVVCG